MKGPGGRSKFVMRREWECPVCHRRELTGGDVTSRLCACGAKQNPPQQNWMRMFEWKPKPLVRTPAPPAPDASTLAELARVEDVSSQNAPAENPDTPQAPDQTAPAAESETRPVPPIPPASTPSVWA